MRTSRSELGWDLGLEIVLSVGMVLGAPSGYPPGYTTNLFLGLALVSSFGTWELSLVGFSLGSLDGLIIVTGEGYLVGLSLQITLGSPLESPNHVSKMPGMLLGAPFGLCIGSEVVGCRYCCFRLTDFRKATCCGVGISCVPPP